jgi:uncharacterized membrane protein YjgN (DUF898 family)
MDVQTTPGAAPAVPTSVEFTGGRGFLLGLVLKNALLTLATLGIYRFWAKTRLRRFFWSNVRIAGEPLEYTGRASELFLGFLKALGILFLISLAQSVMRFLLDGNPYARTAVDALFGFLIAVLILAAFYRMWRYRLSRTTWRGIRFGLDGSEWRYTRNAILWGLAVALTLGVAYPWMRASLARYAVGNARFGQTGFVLEARGSRLALPWILTLVATAILVFITILLVGSSLKDLGLQISSKDGLPADKLVPIAAFVANLALAFVIAAAGFIWFRVWEFRYFAGVFRVGGTQVTASLGFLRIFAMIAISWALFFVVVAGVVGADLAWYQAGGSLFAAGIADVVVLSVTGQLLQVGLFTYGLIEYLCETLTIYDMTPFELAVQSGDRGPETGEGLADALDVGAF